MAQIIYLFVSFCWIVCTVHALYPQTNPKDTPVTARLRWGNDTIKAGTPVNVYIRVEHPKEITVTIADSGKYFSPYEFLQKTVNSRQTSEGHVIDEYRITLRSFLIDSVQYLRLPYQYFYKNQVVRAWTNVDSIRYYPLITGEADLQNPQPLEGFAPVSSPKSYLFLTIILGLVGVILVVLAYFYHRRIRRYFRNRLLNRRFSAFINKLQTLGHSQTDLQTLNQLWKDYLTTDPNRPLNALTATELKPRLKEIPMNPQAYTILLELTRTEEAWFYANEPPVAANLVHLRQKLYQLLAEEHQRRIGVSSYSPVR